MESLLQNLDHRGILTLTINRPQVHNAFDNHLVDALTAALLAAGQDPQVRMVVISGAGKCFSAGADIQWMRGMARASESENEHDALALARLMRTLNYLERPTIARINGHAFGGGVGLVACCDITISTADARFGLTETTLGLVPAVISPYVFRRIGEGQARRYFLTGERFDAQRAVALGLVHDIVAADELDHRLEQTVGRLLRAGPRAVLEAKQLVWRLSGCGESEQLKLDEHTSRLIARLRVSAEGQEGLAAFLEKRHPDWAEGDDG
jgi:methylglutaconyl-CoA hydratase